jgi:hypothetical protein
MERFFLYDPEQNGFEYFATEAARDAEVQKCIDAYLDAGEGWSEDVEQIVVGVITGRATQCDIVRPTGKIDEDGEDEAGVDWPQWMDTDDLMKCNYRIKPVGPNGQVERQP